MTFSVANDDALLGSSYFKMGGRVNWDWPLGNLDLPLNITNVSQNSDNLYICLLYTSPSPRDYAASRMPSSA